MLRLVQPFTSRLAVWSRRIGLFAILIAGFGVYLGRGGGIQLIQALALVGSALFLSAITIVCATGAFITIWRTGAGGLKSAYIGVLASILVLAYPVYLAVVALALPVLNDVTSNFADPPQFGPTRALADRLNDYRPPAYNPALVAAQRQAYPDIQPIIVELSLEESYALVLEAIKPMRWVLVESQPPKPRQSEVRIEAIEYSLLMKLPEDIVIRLRAVGQETHIDMRSVSRLGRHDFGSNAARLRKLTESIATVSREK